MKRKSTYLAARRFCDQLNGQYGRQRKDGPLVVNNQSFDTVAPVDREELIKNAMVVYGD